MRRIVGVMALGMVIAAMAAPIIPLAIVRLEVAELPSLLSAAMRVSVKDHDSCGVARSLWIRIVPAVKIDQATAVLLLC
ncbi:MAG TPA: hypothetical protein VFY05_07780 [Candidatus Angelobacter sp.]|nr:hypothetical protein [Candidatus Angelobacter sp.]